MAEQVFECQCRSTGALLLEVASLTVKRLTGSMALQGLGGDARIYRDLGE